MMRMWPWLTGVVTSGAGVVDTQTPILPSPEEMGQWERVGIIGILMALLTFCTVVIAYQQRRADKREDRVADALAENTRAIQRYADALAGVETVIRECHSRTLRRSGEYGGPP